MSNLPPKLKTDLRQNGSIRIQAIISFSIPMTLILEAWIYNLRKEHLTAIDSLSQNILQSYDKAWAIVERYESCCS